MKESLFNVYFTAEDGTHLVFNSLSCGLAVIDERYEQLQKMLSTLNEANLSHPLKEVLKSACSGAFFIPDDQDEIADYLTKQRIQRYSTTQLGLTIAPTLACNFKCIYCYETAQKGVMGKKTQDSLVAFVKKQADHLQSLDVTWYGGEPMLAVNVIRSLSERLIEICRENKVAYRSYIITNGSLLNEENISLLQKYNVTGAQITVDGPKEVHDSRRISRDGKSSFDRIIANINILLEKHFDVSIRINVDKNNEKSISSLLKYLSANLISKDVKISFGQVTPYTEACKTIESACFDNAAFAKNMVGYYQILAKYGFGETNPFPYPAARFNYCCADMLNAFVVDPDGYMYKCWNDVGNTSVAVGNVCDEDFDASNGKNGKQICHLDPLPRKCSTCSVLPICAGGCSHMKRTGKNAVCSLEKYSIIDVMRTYYEGSKNSRETGKDEK